MFESIKNDKIKNLIIWLLMCIFLFFIQFVMIGLSAMATNAGVLEPTLLRTFSTIPFKLSVVSPSLFCLYFAIKKYKHKEMFLIIVLLNIFIILFIADFVSPAFG